MIRQQTARMCVASGVLLGALALSGCGGDSGTSLQQIEGPTVSQGMNNATGKSFTIPDMGRAFITLQGTKPLEVGFELSDAGIQAQPTTPIDDENPNIYFVPLPAEVTTYTPFKAMLVFYFTGHPANTNPQDPAYRPNGEPEHFHCVFLVNPPAAPDPPSFANEFTTPDPKEIPVGAPAGVPPTIVPGLGQSYDDPTKPAGKPPRITTGNNFLIYKGHLNGIAVGDNVSFLQTQQTETDSVLQPQVYPTAGMFPQTWSIRYDPIKKVHIFSLSNFQTAAQHL